MIVGVQRNRLGKLPYALTPDRNGKPRFRWSPHYRAEGILKHRTCESTVFVWDLNGDGIFDRDDSFGTSIYIDRNSDGEMAGIGEFLFVQQMIESCGDNFVIGELAANGSYLEFARTDLAIPEVGRPVPPFTFETLEGKIISSEELRRKVYLLDFWASWCAPCIKTFPKVQELEKEFEGRLEIVAINLDEATKQSNAMAVIERYGLTWPQVMSGQGTPIYRMFLSMKDLLPAIPLYVLIESGRLRYVGSGGEDLSELKEMLKEIKE